MITKKDISEKFDNACLKIADFVNEHPYLTGFIGGCAGGLVALLCYSAGEEHGIRTAIPAAHKAGARYGYKNAIRDMGEILHDASPDIYNKAGDILVEENFIKPFVHAATK